MIKLIPQFLSPYLHSKKDDDYGKMIKMFVT